MPRPPTARGAIAKRVNYMFLRQALERPAARAQRCQCGYWVRKVPCAVCGMSGAGRAATRDEGRDGPVGSTDGKDDAAEKTEEQEADQHADLLREERELTEGFFLFAPGFSGMTLVQWDMTFM